MSSTTILKFIPAKQATSALFGRNASNLKEIGRYLNSSGDKVTVKFNAPKDPRSSGQFVIISNDRDKALQAMEFLREKETDYILGHTSDDDTRFGGFFSKAITKETDEEAGTITYTHNLITNLAGLVIGKASANLIKAREDHFEADINVNNTDDGCQIIYKVSIENDEVAFKALQDLRKIEREVFNNSQTRFLDSANRKLPNTVDDGLSARHTVTLSINSDGSQLATTEQ